MHGSPGLPAAKAHEWCDFSVVTHVEAEADPAVSGPDEVVEFVLRVGQLPSERATVKHTSSRTQHSQCAANHATLGFDNSECSHRYDRHAHEDHLWLDKWISAGT